jgi:predicted DNA-binding protein
MTRKRIALSVSPKMDDILERLSDFTKQPKSKLIIEMLEEYAPILEQTLNALEQIKANKENAPNIAKQFATEMLLDGNQKLGNIASEVKNLK